MYSTTSSCLALAAAAAGRFSAVYHAVDERGGTAYSLVDAQRAEGAVIHAGPALHAPVLIQDYCFSVLQRKDFMGAHFQAHPATGALFGEKLEA
jgi:hypothetical protein